MINKLKVSLAQVAALTLLLLTTSIGVVGQAQPFKIHYHLAMPHPSSHLFEVSIEVEAKSESGLDSIDFQMPQWSPGRYAVFDFAKNVQEFGIREIPPPNSRCADADAQLNRLDTLTWRVIMLKDNQHNVHNKSFYLALTG